MSIIVWIVMQALVEMVRFERPLNSRNFHIGKEAV